MRHVCDGPECILFVNSLVQSKWHMENTGLQINTIHTWGHQLHEEKYTATQEEGSRDGISPGQVLQQQPGRHIGWDFNSRRKEAVHIDVSMQVRSVKRKSEIAHWYGQPATGTEESWRSGTHLFRSIYLEKIRLDKFWTVPDAGNGRVVDFILCLTS